MTISVIKNKYLRRTTLIVAIPFLYTFGMVGVGLYNLVASIAEILQEMPSAIAAAWHGRD